MPCSKTFESRHFWCTRGDLRRLLSAICRSAHPLRRMLEPCPIRASAGRSHLQARTFVFESPLLRAYKEPGIPDGMPGPLVHQRRFEHPTHGLGNRRSIP